jgi:OFA family oxalate/formate antiporter-like MFS transporter
MSIAKKLADGSRFYYGWIIVAVALISMAIWFGIRSGFSIYYVALLDEFHWSRGASAGAQSIAMITYTIMAPIVGGLIDRFGPRRVIVPGILILTGGLLLCSRIEILTQFYIFYGVVVGTGLACIGIISYSAILAHWFEKKRGLASGIAVSGMGLGTFVLVPMSQSFISMWGWRMTFIITGCLVLIILLPANALFLRHKPQKLGQHPDGLNPADSNHKNHSHTQSKITQGSDWSLKKAAHTLRFWSLIIFPFIGFIGVFIIIVHQVRFLVDQGIDKMTAAFILAMVGIVSSIFRIFWGWLSDRISRELTYTMGMVCGCLGVGSLLLFEIHGSAFFTYSFFVLFGMGWGVTAPMFMAVAADLFKGRIFGLIYGFVEAGIGIAGAIGAWIAGFIFDKTQSYQPAFILVIVAFLLSCVFCWLAAPRKYRNI